MKAIAQLGAAVIIFICSSMSSAWNNFGHEVIAAAAYDRLTPQAKQRVAELLKLNPNYDDWVELLPVADGPATDRPPADRPTTDRERAAFIRAATWADYIRHAPGYRSDDNAKDNRRNTGYADKLVHGSWHYIDLPFSPDATPLIQPKAPNAQTQIAAFRRALADPNAADERKSYALTWLLHLVGDIHQPLHATSRFTRDAIKGDRGGNEVELCAKRCGDELHAFWDDALGSSNDLNRIIAYANKLPAPAAAKAAVSDEKQWAIESFQIAKKSVYADPIGDGLGPYTLNTKYKRAANNIARSRAALAAARLANLLNGELK